MERLKDVENEREFNEIWSEIKHYFENKNIVAHNTSTDISVLEKTLKYYNLLK
jgi:DNA polymerase-3 subunit epsilon